MNTRNRGSYTPAAESAGGSGSRSQQPPPFLTKTYELVDDPSTDPIVSWGADGQR